jgi:hypothetical protein
MTMVIELIKDVVESKTFIEMEVLVETKKTFLECDGD